MMKMTKLLKTVLTASFAFGTVTGAISAAQRVEVHADYRGKPAKHLEVEASRLRQKTEHPEIAVPALAYTDTLAMTHAAKGADIMIFAHKAAAATADMIKFYVDTAMLAPDGPFILPTVANTANVAVDATVAGIVGGGWVAAGFQPNEMPADLTRDAFTTALTNLMSNLDLARLNAAAAAAVAGGIAGAHHPLALPPRLSSRELGVAVQDVKIALHQVIHEWMAALIHPDGPFLHAGLPNAHDAIPLLGAPVAWMPHAASLTRDDFEAALHHIVDQVEHYN